MDRFQAPSFCPQCGKPQSSWLPACRTCGTRFADSCVVCRRAIPVGAGTCADHVGAPIPVPSPTAAPQSPLAPVPPPGAAWGASPIPPPPVVGRAGAGRRTLHVVLGLAAFAIAATGVGAAFLGASGADAETRVRNYALGTGQKEFFASDLQFRATFPTIPSRSTQPLTSLGPGVEMVLYTSDLGSAGFSAGAINLPSGPAFDLNLAVNGAAAATGGHVLSSELITFEGLPAAEFVIAVDGGYFDRGLIVAAPGRVYQLQVVDKTNPPDGYDRFKESFHIAAQTS